MKRYVYIESGRVREILFEFTEDFPDIPIKERYTQKFLSKCVIVGNEEIEIKEGMDYNSETGEFTEHIDPDPEPEVVEENVEEVEENGEGTEPTGSKWSN